MGLYDWYLAVRVRRHPTDPPAHVALIITERDLLTRGAYRTLESFLHWALEEDASRVTVYVSVLDEAAVPTLKQALTEIDTPTAYAVRGPDDTTPAREAIQIGIGLGGKHEFAKAVRELAVEVDGGTLEPDEITASDIEERLVFSHEPDLVIKTGAERLSDFMIWQSVYSELYFTDVNWQNFRRRDYLRALLSYKQRRRRFGR